MSESKKLDASQKNILRLIAKGKQADGWTPVSAMLYEPLSTTTPTELATFERVGDSGRARLTEAGQGVIDAMAWL